MSPPPSSDAANASARTNIFGRSAARYSWLQPSSLLSQPPLRASTAAPRPKPPPPVDTLAHETAATLAHETAATLAHQTAATPAHQTAATVPRPSSPLADIPETFLPSPALSDHRDKSPNLPQSSLVNSPAPPAVGAPQPFGPQWFATFNHVECESRVSAFVHAHEPLDNADMDKLSMLCEASAHRDWFFIILLMFLACHTLHRDSLRSLSTHLSPDALDFFARILGDQWATTSPSNTSLLLFISTYPQPLELLRQSLTEDSFVKAVGHIAACLSRLTQSLDAVISHCRRLETLPTVHELIESFGIRSLLFQKAIFRFLLRVVWGSDSGPFVEFAMQQFMSEQQKFDIELGQSPEVRGRLQNVYRQLFYQHRQNTHLSHLNFNPSIAPHSAPTTSASTATQQSPVLTTVPFLHNTAMAQSQTPRSAQGPSELPAEPQTATHRSQAAPTEAQLRVQMQLHAQAQTQRFPAYFQNQPQAASLSAAPYSQNHGGSFPTQFQQIVLPNQPLPHDANQMRALMLYQQQMQAPQQYVLPSNASASPPLPTQRTHQQHSGRQHSAPRLFFPGPNSLVSQPAHPDYRSSALHQAHMRSPVLGPKQTSASARSMPTDNFRYVVGFALEPHRLTTNPKQEIAFSLSPQAMSRLLKVNAAPRGNPSWGEFDQSSIMLRLRCCEVAPTLPLPTENEWALLHGSWPVQAYFAINDDLLEPRRKLHHGKCLPIDLTHHVRAGVNKIVVRINRTRQDRSAFNYAIAIEVVGFTTRDRIKGDCIKRIIPSEQILNTIKKSLTTDDDDLIMESKLTIGLFEPFSNAKMFDIPVRSQDCLHREVFDLDVFLDTRPKPPAPNHRVSMVDVWRCPICKADSRPKRLIVDGFLMAVRSDLASKGMLKTRAITVDSDSSWSPVQVADDEEETEDESTPAPLKKNIEVIMIDDDSD